MKKGIYISLFLIIFISYGELYSQEYWIQQPSPTSKYLRSIFFTDTLKGWISGDSGLIIHTTDKGMTWTTQPTGLNREVNSLFFINANTGFALSWEFNAVPPNYYGTRILSTVNGGLNWSNYLFPDTNLFLNTIYFRDPLNGYMAGSDGKIFYTTNMGSVWHQAYVDSAANFSFPIEKIKFFDSNTGFAAGGAFDIAGMMWKTTDGGLNWWSVIVGPEPMNDMYIFDVNNIICAGGDFEYGPSKLTTTNSGLNWIYTEFGIFGIANSIDFRTYNEGWISLGIVDTFLFTTDHGNNWNSVSAPNNSRIYDIQFIDQRNGWAVGNGGVILKYNAGIIGINENSYGIPDKIILHQNYPNPFNPSTRISYDLKSSGNVSLKIFDVSGKEITTLVNDFQHAGSYFYDFNASTSARQGINLSSGLYYYRLSSGEFSVTKKMLLIK